MDMDQSIRDSLNQLINLQAQQLQTLNGIVAQNNSAKITNMNPLPVSPTYQSGYANYMPSQSAAFRPDDAMNSIPLVNSFANNPLFAMGFQRANTLSQQQQELYRAQAGSYVSDKVLGGVATVAGMAPGFAAAFLPGVGGLVGGLTGGFGVGIATSYVADRWIKQEQMRSAANEYLIKNSSRFISPSSSINQNDFSGFNRDQRFDVTQSLAKMSAQKNISFDEMLSLLKNFSEGDLLRGTQNTTDFKNKMSKLTDYVKTAAITLNSTYDEVSSMMSEMKAKGIDMKDFNSIAMKSKVMGSFAGLSPSQSMQFAMSSTNINQGTFVDNKATIEASANNLAMISILRDNTKDSQIKNIIANLGGDTGATSAYTAGLQALITSASGSRILSNLLQYSNGKFTLDQDVMNNFLKNPADYKAAVPSWMSNIDTNKAFNNNKGSILAGIFRDNEQSPELIRKLIESITALSGNILSKESALSEIVDPSTAKLMLAATDMVDDPEYKEKLKKVQSKARRQSFRDITQSKKESFLSGVERDIAEAGALIGIGSDYFARVGESFSGSTDRFYFSGRDFSKVLKRRGPLDMGFERIFDPNTAIMRNDYTDFLKTIVSDVSSSKDGVEIDKDIKELLKGNRWGAVTKEDAYTENFIDYVKKNIGNKDFIENLGIHATDKSAKEFYDKFKAAGEDRSKMKTAVVDLMNSLDAREISDVDKDGKTVEKVSQRTNEAIPNLLSTWTALLDTVEKVHKDYVALSAKIDGTVPTRPIGSNVRNGTGDSYG